MLQLHVCFSLQHEEKLQSRTSPPYFSGFRQPPPPLPTPVSSLSFYVRRCFLSYVSFVSVIALINCSWAHQVISNCFFFPFFFIGSNRFMVNCRVEASNESRQLELEQQEQKQLTIFYNGRVLVCDVAELQARAILLLASREMEDRLRSPVGRSHLLHHRSHHLIFTVRLVFQ